MESNFSFFQLIDETMHYTFQKIRLALSSDRNSLYDILPLNDLSYLSMSAYISLSGTYKLCLAKNPRNYVNRERLANIIEFYLHLLCLCDYLG
jgi:hypothetical protein